MVAVLLPPTPRPARDLLVGAILGLVFALRSLTTSSAIPRAIVESHNRDVWFQTAPDSVFNLAGDREHSKHGRNNTHPFFSIVAHPPVQALHRLFGLDVLTGLRLLAAGVAFWWGLCLFLVLRLIRCRSLDAVLLTALAIVSASAIFFFAVPETFSFGSLGMLAALLVLAWSEHTPVPAWGYIGMNLLTFAFVITNWSAGLLVTLVTQPVKEALRIVGKTLAIAVVILTVQKLIYPAVRFIWDIGDELNFVHHPDAGGPFRITASFFYHTMIAPAIAQLDRPNAYRDPGVPSAIMTIQASLPGSGEPWGLLLIVLWTLLLAAGVWALVSVKALPRLRLVVALLLLSQWMLHLNYGEETFLYSLHFVVLLVLLPALATLTPLRPLVLGLLILFLPALAVNNVTQFTKAIAVFQQLQLPATESTQDR